ncbi:tripartite motif-containing protein 16 [Silurus asotus]|uniref:Tripartite motif-containing protein 16 n=1 Tax=Silurus asotus TaxID=30991 RepID=A0AAD5AZU4_SILAS|nr:tripartite motif-containing protein 16 [Silurus asotus]
MVSNKAEITEKQYELKKEQIKFQQRILEKQKKVQELKQTMDNITRHFQAAVDDSEMIFDELISSIKKKRSEMTEVIKAQEKAEMSRAEQLHKQLEQELADLNRRVAELEQLSQKNDHIHFLQSVSPESDDSINIASQLSFDVVRKPLSDLKKQADQIYFGYLTPDPNTAHCQLFLSEKDRAVTCSKTRQQYSDHPERFKFWEQVLCKESVCGRCYWEVEWRSKDSVCISVSYKEISRKGQGYECGFGRNNQSWSLQCSSSSLSFWHNDLKTVIKGPISSRIGVYVDHRAGTLSFYSVSDTMTLLHRVHTTFTQPLYAGFYIWRFDSTVRICHRE